jgi:cephalosporin hydroxylase
MANLFWRKRHYPHFAEDARLAELAKGAQDGTDRLASIVRTAWAEGQRIRLVDAVYGPAHWKGQKKFHDEGFPYYSFLAGFVRTQHCERILEIGTHFGGSALSMLSGVTDQKRADIVTVDVTDLNPALHSISRLKKLTGDANSDELIQQILVHFEGKPIDLLYVDAAHRFGPTLQNIAIYVVLLKPKFVIIDDINLNLDMRALWDAVRLTENSYAVNCCDIEPEIRTADVGFGLVLMAR